MDTNTQTSNFYSSFEDDHINDQYNIDDFTLSFSAEQSSHLSKISGIELQELKKKLPYVVVGLLNKLVLVKGDLKEELEKIIKVRAHFYSPRKDEVGNNRSFSSSGIFFNDSYYALSSLLETDPEEFIKYIADSVSLQREHIDNLFTYLAPYFLNEFAVYLRIENPNFALSISDNINEDILKPELESESSKFLESKNDFNISSVIEFTNSSKIKKFKLFLKEISFKKYLSLFLFFGLLLLIPLYYLVLKQDKIETNLQEEINDISENIPKILNDSVKSSSSESVPLLLPEFAQDTEMYRLLNYLKVPVQEREGIVFRVKGFQFSNGDMQINDDAYENLFFIERILSVYDKTKIVITKFDNRYSTLHPIRQNMANKIFVAELVDLGFPQDRISIENLEESKDYHSIDLSKEDGIIGIVAFRVIENDIKNDK